MVGACSAALVLSAACGSDDGAKKAPRVDETAGAGGDPKHGVNAAGDGAASAGAGSSNAGDASGGSRTTPGGAAGVAGASDVAGAGSEVVAGAAGMAGEGAGGGASCEAVDPQALAGVWTTTCNGYTCKLNVAASGAVATACTNGQYAKGTLADDGALATLGEGGIYQPFSTAGNLTALGCGSLAYAYKARTPPSTGPEEDHACTLTPFDLCQATLLETLAGVWETTCGSATCTTTFTAEGGMSSTCSNGQHSSGSIDETGAFSDTGSGGAFADYSTTGVVALTGCSTMLMPYSWQSPPNQGTKHSAECVYVRKLLP
jgi:hypothetical protein